MSAIATELKHHMQQQQLNARELARKSGVKSSFIYDVLSGKSSNPSTLKLAKVARVLGLSLSQLVEPSDMVAPSHLSVVSARSFDGLLTPPLLNVGMNGEDTKKKPAPFSFSKRWVSELCQGRLDEVACIQIQGDSMSPTLNPRDYVLVDTAQRTPKPPGLYVIEDDTKNYQVRRLEHIPGTYERLTRVSADHVHYSSYELPLERLLIVGRVLWHSHVLV